MLEVLGNCDGVGIVMFLLGSGRGQCDTSESGVLGDPNPERFLGLSVRQILSRADRPQRSNYLLLTRNVSIQMGYSMLNFLKAINISNVSWNIIITVPV